MRQSTLGALVLVLASAPLAAQEVPPVDRDALLARVTGPQRDLATVSRHAQAIDGQLTDLLVALAQKHSIRYRLPKSADPAEALRGLCPGCAPAALLAAGYRELESLLSQVRRILDGRSPFEATAVHPLVERAVLLAAALKSYALLEVIDFRNGGRAGAGSVEGPGGTIANWPGAAALMGGSSGVIHDHIARMVDRRRQAEAVGLEYPNADLTWLVPCLRNCGR